MSLNSLNSLYLGIHYSSGCSACPENRGWILRRRIRQISLGNILLPRTASCLWQEAGALDLREFWVV